MKYCFEIKSWLESVGVNTTPENLNIIIDRVKSQITYLDSVRNNNRNRIEKWSQVLIIPILLAVFSQIIKEQQDLSILFAYTATMLIVIGSFGLVFLNCYNALDFYKKRKLEQMKSFADDLQGVVDSQFDNKLISIEIKEENK